MLHHRLPAVIALVAGSALCAALPARAAMVTIGGPSFDLTYDSALLGPYGTPTIVGNDVFFTTVSLSVQRFDTGSSSLDTLLEGIVITTHGSQRLSSLTVGVLGDYYLDGADASVAVTGRLLAHDASAPATTRTGAALAVDVATPLSVVGTNTDWRASARVDGATTVDAGQTNVFLAGARSIGVSLGTELIASLGSGGGFREAFIEQKFTGLRLTVASTPVAAPGTVALLAAALAAAALVRRRH